MSDKKGNAIIGVFFGLFFAFVLVFVILMAGAQAEESMIGTYYVTGDHVRLREQPNLDAKIVGHYNVGDEVKVIWIEDGWAQLANGNFISMQFLTSEAPEVVPKNEMFILAPGVRERSSADTASDNIVCEHLAGETVTVEGDPVNGWYKLTNGNYISECFLTSNYGDIFTHCAERYKDILIVSIRLQHAIYYHYNARWESDVVTGKPSVSPTPLGLTTAGRKIEGVYLNGNKDTYVDTGVYFKDGFLVHDADDFPWRKTGYGGEIYKTNGSGGCVNAPRSFSRLFHDTCSEYTYVLIIP